MINKMELKFLATLDNELLARQAVVAFLNSINPTMELIGEVKTIVSEAVSNAIIHGYKFDASKEVYIKAFLDNEFLELNIIDFGVGIKNIEEARRPSYTTRPDLERAGMGLTIIETLSDSFAIKSVENMGVKLIVKKRVAQEKVAYGSK